MKFCFLCGKETERLVEGYCEECYNRKFQLIKVPEKISLIVCSKCNTIKHENKWKSINLNDFLKGKIKIFGENVKLKIERNDIFHIHAKGFLKDSERIKEESHNVKLELNKVVCLNCSRKYGYYYEAILQLRGNFSNGALNFIKSQIEKDKKAYFRIEKVKNGFDFYIGSKAIANNTAKVLKKKFNAEIKKSFKLITKKEGKDIYRNVILVRM